MFLSCFLEWKTQLDARGHVREEDHHGRRAYECMKIPGQLSATFKEFGQDGLYHQQPNRKQSRYGVRRTQNVSTLKIVQNQSPLSSQ